MLSATDHVEYRGGKGSPWVWSRHPLNGSTKYPPALATMVSQSQYVRRSRSVRNLKAYFPIQGIVCLLEVQEYLEEDRLPHGHKLLKDIGLEGGGPRPTACPKPVQHIKDTVFRKGYRNRSKIYHFLAKT